MISLVQIDTWWQLAMASTPGELLPCFLGDPTNGAPVRGKAEIGRVFIEALAGLEAEEFHGVLQRCPDLGDAPGGDVPIAWFGCGPAARANADFFREARAAVVKLTEENAALRQKLTALGVKL